MEIQKKVVKSPEDIYIPPQATDEDFEQYTPQLSKEDAALLDLHERLIEVYGDQAPILSQLEGWKKRWGNIHVSKISSERKELYIWRTLKRHEYKDLAKGGAMEDSDTTNEMLVEKCMLFPSYDFTFRQQTDAGIITTLGQQISYKSGFVSPQEALSLVFVA